jgi:hypothetical protein
MRTLEAAKRFLREHYLGEFNRRFRVPVAQRGHAFLPVNGQNLAQDNTVKLGERIWQIEKTPWRGTLAGCRVLIAEHLDGRVTISYGPHVVGRYTAQGVPLTGQQRTFPGRRRGGSWALTSVALRAPSVSAQIARA